MVARLGWDRGLFWDELSVCVCVSRPGWLESGCGVCRLLTSLVGLRLFFCVIWASESVFMLATLLDISFWCWGLGPAGWFMSCSIGSRSKSRWQDRGWPCVVVAGWGVVGVLVWVVQCVG